MEPIEPTWGPPVAYLYALKLDDRSRAWEYLRRNPRYRSDYGAAIRHPERNIRPNPWGLKHWEDPREDARSVEPAWLSVAKSEVFLVRGRAGTTSRFDFWRIPGRKTLCHDGDCLNLITRRGSELLHRVRWTEELSEGDPLGVSVGGGRGFSVRSRAAHGLLRAFERGTGEAPPERTERPSINALTHMQSYQALDGDAAGASHREIARRLFSLCTDFTWDPDSRYRARVRYLIECGRRRSDRGYRRMVGLGDRESESARSPPGAPRAVASDEPNRNLAIAQCSTSFNEGTARRALA